MRMRFGFTVDNGDAATWAIKSATGGAYSHVLVVFYNDAERVFFESIWKKDKRTKQNGVRGPYELERIQEWAEEKPRDRKFATYPETGYLPLSIEEVDAAYNILATAASPGDDHVKYARLQLVQNWIAARTGWNLYRRDGSTHRWTCSETCVRAMPPRVWHCFDLLNTRADAIVPAGGKVMSIERGAAAMVREFGDG